LTHLGSELCIAAFETMLIFAEGEKQSWSTATGCKMLGILAD